MPLRSFVSAVHKSSGRDYIARAADPNKARNAEKACQWGFDYWDGSRSTGYGGYFYDGRWRPVAEAMVAEYGLKAGMRVLDVGCGKGHLLYDLQQACPGLIVSGLDISAYAIEQAKPEVREFLVEGDAGRGFPWPSKHFDLAVSVTTLHNLFLRDIFLALREMERVARGHRYVCVEAYGNERQKWNLMCWQLTCQAFHTPEDWAFIFDRAGYKGDSEFIFFD